MKAGDQGESINAYLKAAWYLGKSGFLKKALAVYKMALRYDPDNDEAIRAANKIMMEVEAPQRLGLTQLMSSSMECITKAMSALQRII